MTVGELIVIILISTFAIGLITVGIAIADFSNCGVFCVIVGIIVLIATGFLLFKECCPEGLESVKNFWKGITDFLNTPLKH